MPKADRILANLPPTFRVAGDLSALRALADAYGGELQTAENALVAVMRAHWVELADAGERQIVDLARFAALYGLAPRPDESVEEFRDHLRRFVRTHLDGTVTVRGLLRITAEALGLHIEDDALDTWWDRPDPVLVTSTPRGEDATDLVLGVAEAAVHGQDVSRATLVGLVDLTTGVDLSGPHRLWVALDGGGVLPVDLRAGVVDVTAATPGELAAAVDAGLGTDGVGRVVDGRLVLVSPTAGTASEVVVGAGADDAADLVLGLRPRAYTGADPTHARIVGRADLSAALDLTRDRYVRLVIDGTRTVEVDCAARAADPAAVDVADVTSAINDAFAPGTDVASDDGRFLTLTSPTAGADGSVVVLDPAAQPATNRLLGAAPRVAVGTGSRPARVVSDRSIGLGVDLSTDSVLRLQVDAQPAVTIDVAGLDPRATTPAEIVAAVNEGLGAQSASHDGDRITLVSPTDGAAGLLTVEEVPGDAALAVLGLRPRSARGAAPVTASLEGGVNLAATVDLSAQHVLALGVDGAPVREIDLRAGVTDVRHATVDELRRAVNTGLGVSGDAEVATDDGAHLILVSTTPGAAGSIVVAPLRSTARRRFVTRARVTDDAAQSVLGFTERVATGTRATSARIAGAHDLSNGVDLGVDRYVRLTVGDRPAVDIDCAGPRARATTPAEIAAAINAVRPGVALTDGHHVVLTDPVPGAASRLVLEPPRWLDALDPVLGVEPGLVRGRDATGVRFVGTVDLTAGVELPADATLRLAIDGAPGLDVLVGDGSATATRPLSQLVAQLNLALGAQVAAHDGTHLLLTSPPGATSALTIDVPTTGSDATAAVLGVSAPRTYTGGAATAARVVGTVDLTGGADLRTAHLLQLAVDGGPHVTVDLAAGVPAAGLGAVDLATLTAAIRAATTADAASVVVPGGLAIAITSPSTGMSSRIELLRPGAGDAAPLVLGGAGLTATGTDPEPAVLDGVVDLLAPVDLSRRSVLRIAVDGGEPVDVDVAGVTPSATLLDEIVEALDTVLPGVAQAGPTQRLRLRSPTAGPDSRVAVIPVRHLEVVEYPPVRDHAHAAVAHGTVLHLTSTGSADVPGTVEVVTARGVLSPRLSDPAAGWWVRVRVAIEAGSTLTLEPTPAGGVTATVVAHGVATVLAPELVDVVPAPAGAAGAARPRPGAVAPLTVRRGRNRWSWAECDAARFDDAVFDTDRFAGGACVEEAVFDVSRFSPVPLPAVFADSATRHATAQVTVTWDSHTAGALEVNLPADLDVRFGRPFDEARFGTAEPQVISGVVTDPIDDPSYVLRRINATTPHLITAEPATSVPIGWRAVPLPFRHGAPLTLGRPDRAARLYVSGPGLDPPFLLLQAAHPGAYGNDIQVSARLVGPEIYDLEITLAGTRFECARDVVLGPPPPTLADALLAPGPVGVGTATAAGVHAVVTRDRVAGSRTHQDGLRPDEEGSS